MLSRAGQLRPTAKTSCSWTCWLASRWRQQPCRASCTTTATPAAAAPGAIIFGIWPA